VQETLLILILSPISEYILGDFNSTITIKLWVHYDLLFVLKKHGIIELVLLYGILDTFMYSQFILHVRQYAMHLGTLTSIGDWTNVLGGFIELKLFLTSCSSLPEKQDAYSLVDVLDFNFVAFILLQFKLGEMCQNFHGVLAALETNI